MKRDKTSDLVIVPVSASNRLWAENRVKHLVLFAAQSDMSLRTLSGQAYIRGLYDAVNYRTVLEVKRDD